MKKSKTTAGSSTRTPPPKTLSRNELYGLISTRGDYLISKLFEDCESNNPSIRIAALRTLLDKILPSLKATELSGKDGDELKNLINVIIQSK
jgi:hypothetical protein